MDHPVLWPLKERKRISRSMNFGNYQTDLFHWDPIYCLLSRRTWWATVGTIPWVPVQVSVIIMRKSFRFMQITYLTSDQSRLITTYSIGLQNEGIWYHACILVYLIRIGISKDSAYLIFSYLVILKQSENRCVGCSKMWHCQLWHCNSGRKKK